MSQEKEEERKINVRSQTPSPESKKDNNSNDISERQSGLLVSYVKQEEPCKEKGFSPTPLQTSAIICLQSLLDPSSFVCAQIARLGCWKKVQYNLKQIAVNKVNQSLARLENQRREKKME